jgi:ABC-type transporter Mla subunit MlaD
MTNSDDVLLAVSTRLESIDTSLQSVVSLLERVDGRLETNEAQIAAFMEGLTRLENTVNNGFERLERNLTNLESLIRQQHETTQMQARHIDRLIALTETLIQQRVA